MDSRNNKRAVGVFPLLLVFLLVSCDTKTTKQYPFVHHGQTMGTSFTIKASAVPKNVDPQDLKQQIESLLHEINSSMSTYIETSEISIFNQSTSTEWLDASPHLFKVLKTAHSISKLTQGAFDISIGPLVNLWGFGPEKMTFSAPEETKIKQRLNQIGYQNLLLTESPNKIKKVIPALYLDLSALAKGYAVDQVGLLMEQQGLTSYLVEIGGEIKVKGKNIQGQLWRIAIEKPISNNRAIHKIVPISDIAMATSGDYRNYFEEQGVRFSHTIDPRTGYPVAYKLASVTILSKSTMEADAIATAMMVLGPDEGYQIAEQKQIAAFFIIKTDTGFEEKSTSEFKKLQQVKQ
jgi:thiamine biosynthesis lipoprotein